MIVYFTIYNEAFPNIDAVVGQFFASTGIVIVWSHLLADQLTSHVSSVMYHDDATFDCFD
jgi:hypothetical protein